MRENTNELGRYIKTARTKLNLSLRKLSEKINIDHSEISRVENGHRKKPNVLFLIGIAKYLNLNIEKLMKLASYTDAEIKLVVESK